MAKQHQFAQHCVTERDAALAQLRKIAAERDASDSERNSLREQNGALRNERDALAAALREIAGASWQTNIQFAKDTARIALGLPK